MNCTAGMMLLTSTLLTGCLVGPNYKRPESGLPAGYAAQTSMTLAQSPEVAWWRTFEDEQLNALVNTALGNNLDLRAAEARVLEARALRRQTAADLYPQVGFNAGYTRNYASENLVTGGKGSSGSSSAATGSSSAGSGTGTGSGTGSGSGDGSGSGTGTGTGTGTGGTGGTGAGASASSTQAPESTKPELYSNLYQLGFDASWELDLFGRTRRRVQAADAEIEAAVDSQRNTLVSLLGELARNYVELRGFQRELDIAKRNIHAQEETVNITRVRFEAGLTSELDVANARAQLATTRSSVPPLERQVRQAGHRISVLTGQQPEALLNDLLTTRPIPTTAPEVPVGLPSELLRRRPDIREAERRLAASNARIGAAVGDLFPRVTLNGSAGLQAGRAEDFIDWDSRTWSFGPSVRVPIFQGGRLRAAVQAANATQQESLASYEQAVLLALEEVENALTTYDRERARNVELARAVAANQRAFELSNTLYTRGLTDFLNVLTAQRGLFLSEDALAQSDTQLSASVVAIYKALGGGWEERLPEEPRVASAEQKAGNKWEAAPSSTPPPAMAVTPAAWARH